MIISTYLFHCTLLCTKWACVLVFHKNRNCFHIIVILCTKFFPKWITMRDIHTVLKYIASGRVNKCHYINHFFGEYLNSISETSEEIYCSAKRCDFAKVAQFILSNLLNELSIAKRESAPLSLIRTGSDGWHEVFIVVEDFRM